MSSSSKLSLPFPLKLGLPASPPEWGWLRGGAGMGPGHIFQPFVNNCWRNKVVVLTAMPFNPPLRVREDTWRLAFQSSKPFSTVLFTDQTRLKIDYFLLSGSQERSILFRYSIHIRKQRSCWKHLLQAFNYVGVYSEIDFTLKIVPVNTAFLECVISFFPLIHFQHSWFYSLHSSHHHIRKTYYSLPYLVCLIIRATYILAH